MKIPMSQLFVLALGMLLACLSWGAFGGTQRRDADAAFDKLLADAKRRLKAESRRAGTSGPGAIGVVVDPRIELFTVIFRLGGSDEFRADALRAYGPSIDATFQEFAEHPAVQLARKLRTENGTGSDAVMGLAIRVSDPPSLEPKVDFSDPELTHGWRKADAEKFVELARDFAAKSHFMEFFRRSEPLYELARLRMRKIVARWVDPQWFPRYFGEKPTSRLIVAIDLLGGSISYGVRMQPASGLQQQYAVMGTWLFDKEGLPMFDESVVPTIVHEFNHSYVNPAVGRREAEFRAVGQALQPKLATYVPLMGQFYWKTLFEESLVRAAVVRYLETHVSSAAANAETTQQIGNGFLWTDDLASLLAQYEGSRRLYPTFDSFLPKVIDYFKGLPERMPAKVARLDAQRPQVLRTSPQDGAEDVDASLGKIEIAFDRPMQTGTWAVLSPEGADAAFPRIASQGFDKAGKVFTMIVKLEPGRTYEIRLNSSYATGFRSAPGIPLAPRTLRFKTRGGP
jgi:hypothetical protein